MTLHEGTEQWCYDKQSQTQNHKAIFLFAFSIIKILWNISNTSNTWIVRAVLHVLHSKDSQLKTPRNGLYHIQQLALLPCIIYWPEALYPFRFRFLKHSVTNLDAKVDIASQGMGMLMGHKL